MCLDVAYEKEPVKMGTLPVLTNNNAGDIFSQRVRQILGTMAILRPQIMVLVDLYRPAVVDTSDYPDDQSEVFVRLAEDITAYKLVKEDKFYQAEVGLILTRIDFLILPAGFGIEPDDHAVISGVPYLITDSWEEMGVCKAIISQPKNRFIRAGRGTPTYRQTGIGAFIV